LYAVVPYLVVTLIFVVFQRRLMYQPTVIEGLRFADVVSSLGRDVSLRSADGNMLRGWLLYGRRPNTNGHSEAPLVLYFPGNSLNRSERIDDLREIASQGFDVLIFDYRGFGDSTGSPTESSLSKDARQIWRYARDELGYSESRIVIFGESLGGAVTLSLWSKDVSDPPHPAAVILNSTFTSLPAVVAWHYPLFPFRWLLLDCWPSIERIPRVDAPVIIFHGTQDEMVPIAQGRRLANAVPHARFIEIPGGTHNEIPMMRLQQEMDRLLAILPPDDPIGMGDQSR
jgi:fermentation-respiration switch protein FrsA (DUF1100 family)